MFTIQHSHTASFTERRSRFLAFAHPAATAEEAMARVKAYEREYYDARHVCYAYRIGPEGDIYRANDNGEPSGTAGRPILGQIDARGLTDVVVVVVRYFGGIKLGTSGLAAAYRQAACDALEGAELREVVVEEHISVRHAFALTGEVMRVVKATGASIVGQDCEESVTLHLRVRQEQAPAVIERLQQIYGVEIIT